MKKPLNVLTASLLAGTVFASSVSPAFAEEANTAVQSDSLVDIEGTIYKEAVEFLVKNDIASGFPGRFGVEEPIKRVDSAIMMAKYLGLDIQYAAKTNFKDVPARAIPYVAALKEAEIVNGKSAVYFGAVENITRGEAAIIFHRAFGMALAEGTSETSTSTKFTDVTGRYVEAVNFLVDRGVIQGKANNRFGTNELLTRGQFALMVYRMSQYERPDRPWEFVNS